MRELSCSQLPALEACPSYVSDGKSSPPADLGTLVHKALAAKLRGEEPPDLDDEGEMLVERGIKAWNEVQSYFPRALIEESSSFTHAAKDWTLTGHPDVAQPDEAVLDWKSGWKERDYSLQLGGYALLAGANKAVVVWLRDTKTPFEVLKVDREDTIKRIDRIVARAGEATPCDFCSWCGHFGICKARVEADGHAVQTFRKPLGELSAQRFATLYPLAAQVKRTLKQYEEALRRHVEHEGSLDLGDGYELRMKEEPRSTVDVGVGWELLWKHLQNDPKAVSSCVKVVKKALRAAIGAKHEKGKGKAVSECFGELRDAGAIVDQAPVKKLVRAKKEETDAQRTDEA